MGMTVTITDNDDGTYGVSASDADEQATSPASQGADEGAGTGDDSGSGADSGQTVNSIGEALRVARDLLTHDAQVEDADGQGGQSEDDNSPMSGDQAKAAWDDEATKKAQSKQLFGG
jgi:hypothetical protein